MEIENKVVLLERRLSGGAVCLAKSCRRSHASRQFGDMQDNKRSRRWRDPGYWIAAGQLLIAVLAFILNR
jgi:hypothetical protein